MIMKMNTPVSVNLVYNHKTRSVFPSVLLWEGRKYPITKIGMHHTFRNGRTLLHVFSVETDSLYFRLVLDTDTLHWRVEEISDGEPN